MKIIINKHSDIYKYFKEFKNDKNRPNGSNEKPSFVIGLIISLLLTNMALFIIPDKIELLNLYYIIPLTIANFIILVVIFIQFLDPFIYKEFSSDYYDKKLFLEKDNIYKKYNNHPSFVIKIINFLFSKINNTFFLIYEKIDDTVKLKIFNYFLLFFVLYFVGYNVLTYLIYIDYFYMSKENYYIFNFFLGLMNIVTYHLIEEELLYYHKQFIEGNYVERIKKYYMNDQILFKINKMLLTGISIIVIFFIKNTKFLNKIKTKQYSKWIFLIVFLCLYNYLFNYIFFLSFFIFPHTYSDMYSWVFGNKVNDYSKDILINRIFKVSFILIHIFNIWVITQDFNNVSILFTLYGKVCVFLFITIIIIFAMDKVINRIIDYEIIKYEDDLAKFILKNMD